MTRKFSTSVWMAIALAAAVALWMATGIDRGSGAPAEQAQGSARPESLVRVRVQDLHARSIGREIVVSGRTEPNRTVEVRAETDGRVVGLGAARGSAVAEGERLVLLDRRDRDARREEARAASVLLACGNFPVQINRLAREAPPGTVPALRASPVTVAQHEPQQTRRRPL